MSQKKPADSVRELGPETTKAAIRDTIWRYIEDNDLAEFPRPVTRRIPNVKVSNKSRLLFSSAEMFKKPLWQTVLTQIRLLL